MYGKLLVAHKEFSSFCLVTKKIKNTTNREAISKTERFVSETKNFQNAVY